MKTLLALLVLAVPISAQQTQTTVVPDVTVQGDSIYITNEITVMSDSVRLARIAVAVESIAAALEECGCTEQQGTSNVVRIGQGALVLAAFFIGFQLKGIKDNTASKNDPVSEDPPSSNDDYPESQ